MIQVFISKLFNGIQSFGAYLEKLAISIPLDTFPERLLGFLSGNNWRLLMTELLLVAGLFWWLMKKYRATILVVIILIGTVGMTLSLAGEYLITSGCGVEPHLLHDDYRIEQYKENAKLVNFTTYVPGYIPPEYTLTKQGVTRTNGIVSLFMRYKARYEGKFCPDGIELTINQFKRPAYFDPPINCGTTEGVMSLITPCPLLGTTSRGRSIYGYDFGNGGIVFISMNDTVIAITHSLKYNDQKQYDIQGKDTQELISIVDSFEEVRVTDLNFLIDELDSCQNYPYIKC